MGHEDGPLSDAMTIYAGTDRDGYALEARQSNDGYWVVRGEKSFVAAAADAHVVLGQGIGGLSAFLVPRITPDGAPNGIEIVRLKP